MKNLFLIILFLVSAVTGLAQAKYTSRGPAPTYPDYVSPRFGIPEGVYFNLEHDNTAGIYGHTNILDWLRGRVAGLQVYTIRGYQIPFMRNYPATIYIDEIRVDASTLHLFPVTDIALIKVIKGPQAGILGGPGGAIAVYTKRGESEEEEG